MADFSLESFDGPDLDLESFKELMAFKGYNPTKNFTLALNDSHNDSSWKMTDFLEERIIIDVYLVTVLICFGFVGNILTIAVLCRERDKNSSTNWLLQRLAVVDTIYLIASIFIQPLKTINEAKWSPSLQTFSPYMDVYVWALASIAHTITVWTVVVLTVDRYIAVCRPYSAHLRTVKRAEIAMAVVVIAAIVYNIPNFLERRISHEDQPEGGRVIVSAKTAISFTSWYSVFYKTICYFVMRSIGPLLLLVVLNALLIRALHRIDHRRKDLVSKASQHRENITLMLIVVVTVFIVCQIPDVVLRLIATKKHPLPGSPGPMRLRLVNSVTNFMLTLNSSVNFLIYCLIGRKFRRSLVRLFAGCPGAGGQLTASENFERQPLDSFPAEAKSQLTHAPSPGVISCELKEMKFNSRTEGPFKTVCLIQTDPIDNETTAKNAAAEK